MTFDHIKIRWLQEFLEQMEFLNQYNWTVYTDNDSAESATVLGEHYECDVEYDIILHIQEYTRSSIELRRLLTHWLSRANPVNPIEINIEYRPIDASRTDLVVTMPVEELQRDIECPEANSEGQVTIDGRTVFIRMDRTKPSDLVNFEEIQCTGEMNATLTRL